MRLLYLSRAEVESLGISMGEVIAAVEEGFRAKGEGLVELPPKPGVHPRRDSFIHAMPAYVGGSVDAAGIKWVFGYPENPQRGLPYIGGLMVLNDADTGMPLAVMDCTWITAVRTGAASAVAARHLFGEGKEADVAILGLGVQGRSHLLALSEVLRVRRFLLYDVSERRAADFVEEMSPRARGAELVICRTFGEATREADVVVSATPILERPNRFVGLNDLKADGFLAISIDYDAAFKEEVPNSVDLFVVDDREQYLWTQRRGPYFRGYPDRVELDMGEVCARGSSDLASRGRRMALLMGIASHDVVTARLIYRRAVELGVGTLLPL